MPHTVEIGPRDLIVFAGLPGAGKSTVLNAVTADVPVKVLDSEQMRALWRRLLPERTPYRWYRFLVHAAHRSRIAWFTLVAPRPVVAHEPATRASTRALLVVIGVLGRRRRLLRWLHVEPSDAWAGQRARGRWIRSRSFARHVHRAQRMHRRLVDGAAPRGWCDVVEVTRAEVLGGLRLRAGGSDATEVACSHPWEADG